MNVAAAERTPRRGLGRLVGAVIAGFLVIVVLSSAVDAVMHGTGIFPSPGQPMATELWVLATLYRLVICIGGCALAARLASDRPMRAAWTLGVIGIVLSTLGAVLTWNEGPAFGPKWYAILLVLTALPCAWVGGTLGRMWSARRAA